jgi:hypothetical protein
VTGVQTCALPIYAGSSALRLLTHGGEITTLVGDGLFESGAKDGPADVARLQHPLGVAAADGAERLFVTDTFNDAVRVWERRNLTTLPAAGLREPGGLDVLPDGRLVVADTNNHRVVVVDPSSGAVEPLSLDDTWVVAAAGPPVTAPAGGPVAVPVDVHLVDEEVDGAAAEPVRVTVDARPRSLLQGPPQQPVLAALRAGVQVGAGRPGTGVLLVEVLVNTRRGDQRAVRVHRRRHLLRVH